MKKPAGVVLALLIAFLATTTLVLKIQTRALSFCQVSSATLISSDDHFTVTVSLQSVYQSAVPTLTFDMPQSLPARLNLVGSAFAIDLPDSLAKRPTTVMIDYVPVTQVNEADLVIAHYDTHANKWLPLPTAIDPVNHTAVTTIEHAGQYALVWLQAIRPLPNNAVIVDDQDEGFARYGHVLGWHSVSGSENHFYLGHMYWTSSTQTTLDNYAIWTPTLASDPYEVYAFIDWDYATTERARYQIVHNGQTTVYTLSQNDYYAEWVSLGVYNFGSDSASNYVRLEDVTGESEPDKQVGFDAIGFVLNKAYLPITLRGYSPLPMKSKSGVHLGSRQDNWPSNTLSRIGDNADSGIWPRAVVVQSNQLYYLDRRPPDQGNGLCQIAQARVREGDLYDYLTKAQRNGVKVVIRIVPSPGNFEDWNNPSLEHILRASTIPASGDYCDGESEFVRAIDDIAIEMDEIYKLNVRRGWNPANFFFEPANEPNSEWYSDWDDPEAQERIRTADAWADMNDYFSALYDHVNQEFPEADILVLTPPMAQGNFAETKRFASCAPMKVSPTSLETGYDWMATTFTAKNDGYSWHNYWRQGREAWVSVGEPCPASEHIFQYFPQWLQDLITSGDKPSFITEADLFSPCQESDNPIQDKDEQFDETQESLWQFVFQEQGADSTIAWLLTEHPYSVKDACPTGLVNYEEIKWHQAYIADGSERAWFWPWWSRSEE